MSRTVAAADPVSESFAGVLEKLTHGAGRGASGSKVESAELLEADTYTGGRSSIRPLMQRANRQTAAVTAGKGRMDAEGMQLSYEQALRRHSRRRDVAADASVFSQTIARPASPGSEAKKVPDTVKATTKRTVRAADPTLTPAKSKVGAGSRRSDQTILASEASRAGSGDQLKQDAGAPRGRTKRTAAKVQEPAKVKAATRGGVRRKEPKARVASDGVSPTSAANVDRSKANFASRRRAAQKAAQTVLRENEIRKADSLNREFALNSTRAQSNRMEVETLRALVRPERRESIVSLRLNDAEHERLRLRASESGISVSAYMRSCVLEAEHLRAQVKQALAEMRASSLRQETGRLSVAVSGAEAGSGAMWSRLLYRSATFLLGPWLAFRSSR